MQIIVSKNSGFCFGVKRAMKLALDNADSGAYTLGALIHNDEVVKELAQKGVLVVNDVKALNYGDTLIISAHGAPRKIIEECAERGIRVVDATCPFVKRIHKLVEESGNKGNTVIIIGRHDHPEVRGIAGWCTAKTYIVESEADIDDIEDGLDATVVVQTTCEPDFFNGIVDLLKKKCGTLLVHNTICDTTVLRQTEAAALSARCTTMIVIGGKMSANTQKLSAICKKKCKKVISIGNPNELVLEIIEVNGIIGIVAGASTPDWMIREVFTRMSEMEKTMAECPNVENMETKEGAAVVVDQPIAAAAADKTDAAEATEFAEAFEKTLVRIRNGQIITGSVVQIVDGEVCVNIGYKSDGFIPRSEFSSDNDVIPGDVVKIGDEIEVEVLKVNDGEGNVLLSRKNVEGKKVWDEFMQDPDISEKVFAAVGKEVVKGGLIASINGMRAFVPASHVSTKYVENLSEFVGKPMKLKVIEVDKARKRIVASQKEVLIAEAEVEKKKKWALVEAGTKVTGVVRRLTDFGAFVDIGGIDGLVHVTDVAWGRVKHPSDVLKCGQEIEVLVLNVDPEKERISLGYKQLQPKPWTLAADKYPVGTTIEGKVVRIVPFGAFVALEPTIDGLIHISQVSVRRIVKVEDEVNVGDIVRCKVLDVNVEAKRISLSRKDVLLEENPELAEQIAKERQEQRDRFNQERAPRQDQQRDQQQPQQQSQQQPQQQRPDRQDRAPRPQRSQEQRGDRQDRRPRREDGDYQLPPVQQATTSLADLFSNFTPEGDE